MPFENKHFELVARCLNQWKNMKGFGNNHLITLPGAAFLCERQSYFLNYNNRRMTLAHTAIFLSLMQLVKGYLVVLKDLDYSCSLGYKRPNTSKSKWRHVDEMNDVRGL